MGTLTLANGNIFKGIFNQGVAPKFGRIEYQQISMGGVFAGYLKNKLKRKPTQEIASRKKLTRFYIGEVHNYRRQGLGRMTEENMDIYEG